MLLVTTIMTPIFASDSDGDERSRSNSGVYEDAVPTTSAPYGINGISDALGQRLTRIGITADCLQSFTDAEMLICVLDTTELGVDDVSYVARILFPDHSVTVGLSTAALAPLPATPDHSAAVDSGSRLPESVARKLERAGIAPEIFRTYKADDVLALSCAQDFTPFDIAYIDYVLFGVRPSEKYVALQAASEAAVAKMIALQRHPKIASMRDVVASVLKQINTFGDVHQHDAFCNANINNILQIAKDMGFGKSNFQVEVAEQKASGKETDEMNEVLVQFFMLFSTAKVQAEHGVSSSVGDEWISNAIQQATKNSQVLSLVVYTVSILDELKSLDGQPAFDTLKYLVLQQIMENYKENGGCLEGVRNRAMKSLAMLLQYILSQEIGQ